MDIVGDCQQLLVLERFVHFVLGAIVASLSIWFHLYCRGLKPR